MQPLQVCIGPIIRIGRESWCLPYAKFLYTELQTLIDALHCTALYCFQYLLHSIALALNCILLFVSRIAPHCTLNLHLTILYT